MSRSQRKDVPNRDRPAKITKTELQGRLYRKVKRRLIADGLISDPSKARPKFDWHWAVNGEVGGVIEANTRSEARARIKEQLMVGKLPDGLQIVKVIPNADSAKRVAACQIGPVSP
jgi:hypothetical protein